VKGMAFAGAVKALAACGLMDGVKRVCGSSAGSGCAFLVALGCSLEEVEAYSAQQDFNGYKDRKWGMFRDAKRAVKELGLHAGGKLRDFWASVAKEKVGEGEVTFKELREKTGMDLTITASNVSRGETVYFDADNTPDMACVDAVRISSSIPFFFAAVEWEDDVYVEGGLLRGAAMERYDAVGEDGRRRTNPNVLSVVLTTAGGGEIVHGGQGALPGAAKMGSLLDLGVAYTEAWVKSAEYQAAAWEEQRRKVVKVDAGGSGVTDLECSKEAREGLVQAGYETTLEFLERVGFKVGVSENAVTSQGISGRW